MAKITKVALQFKYDSFSGELTKIQFTKEFMQETDLMQADVLMDIRDALDQLKEDIEANRERKWNEVMTEIMAQNNKN